MDINFYITEQSVNDMDIVEYEAFERAMDGDVKLYRLRPAIARFMVDENNRPIPHAQALKISDKLKVKDVKDFLGKFFQVMQDSAVKKTRESELKSPSEEVSTSLSPVGSQT